MKSMKTKTRPQEQNTTQEAYNMCSMYVQVMMSANADIMREFMFR